MRRREFLQLLSIAAAAASGGCATRGMPDAGDLYDAPAVGNLRLLHITDSHAQLLPVYYREPSVNMGLGEAWGRPPHLVGDALLEHAGLDRAAVRRMPSRIWTSQRLRDAMAKPADSPT